MGPRLRGDDHNCVRSKKLGALDPRPYFGFSFSAAELMQ
jgi:hypothetical protein